MGASLCGADLRSAHLQGVDLSNANLSQANLEQANLKVCCPSPNPKADFLRQQSLGLRAYASPSSSH